METAYKFLNNKNKNTSFLVFFKFLCISNKLFSLIMFKKNKNLPTQKSPHQHVSRRALN